jgi:hypothetical protein
MDRRTLLLGGLALSASTVLPRLASAQQPAQLPAKIVDVHCHIFNADDLPMVEFVEKSFVRASFGQKKVDPYAPILNGVLRDLSKRLTDGARDEDKYLDAIKTNLLNKRSPEKIAEYERKILAALFNDWKDRPLQIQGKIKLDKKAVARYLPHLALGLIRRETFHKMYQGPTDFSFGTVLNNSDGAFSMGAVTVDNDDRPPLDPVYLADQVYFQQGGKIAKSIIWAIAYTRYRRELVEKLIEANDRRAILVTPALVDFAKWLDADEKLLTPVAKQAAIMERLSRERTPDIPPLHGFVPFDPLRQAIHVKTGGAAAASPLSIVQKAVLQQGFIGVKLYPPMGFRPTNNFVSGDDFKCCVSF